MSVIGTDSRGRRTVVGCCPLDCPDACSWVVTLDDEGRAVRLRGNPEHPFTNGGLCPKVNPWLTYATDPSRLMQPLRRTGPKGSGEFAPISWDEALDEIAERFLAIRDGFGAEAVWPFTGTGNVGWINGPTSGRRLWHAFGASGHRVTICSVTGHVGLSHSQGRADGLDPEDVALADLVVIWGANPLVTDIHWRPFVDAARERGATVVVIDPCHTRTAGWADVHVAPRPGTDLALALGVLAALDRRDALDRAWIADHSVGWGELAATLGSWTLERTAAVTGLDIAEIEGFVELLAAARVPAVKLGQGMQRTAHGGETARAVSCLVAALGAYRHRGGGLVYSTSPAYDIDEFALTRPDLRPAPARKLAMTHLVRHLTETDDPPVQALWIQAANPVVSNPDADGVRRALSRDDLFTVAVELYPTPTTAYADIVLPSTMQHEQTELQESFAHLYLNWNEPAVEPPGECRSHTDIIRALAPRLGLDRPEVMASDHELAAAALGRPRWRDAGITVETFRERGFVRIPGTEPHRPFADGFPTPSGRFQFAADSAVEMGLGRVPTWSDPAEPIDDDHPFVLVAVGSPDHVNSVFVGTERVAGRTGTPVVIVNAEQGSSLGLTDGDDVVVENERGRWPTVVQLDEHQRPGVAFTSKGWWDAALPGAAGPNVTVAEADADVGNGPRYHDNRVRIVKA